MLKLCALPCAVVSEPKLDLENALGFNGPQPVLADVVHVGVKPGGPEVDCSQKICNETSQQNRMAPKAFSITCARPKIFGAASTLEKWGS